MRKLLILVFVLAGCATHRFEKQHVAQLAPPASPPDIHADYAIPFEGERVELTEAYFKLHAPGQEFGPSFEMQPQVVVVHFTAIPSLAKTIAVFEPTHISSDRTQVAKNGDLNVGIQFVVDRDGTIYGLYPETTMARHVIGLNHVAIGIENVGSEDISRGQLKGTLPAEGNGLQLTPQQLSANVQLIRYLKNKYPTIQWVIGHQEYRDLEHPKHPGHDLFLEAFPDYRTEKTDPGKRFLKALRQRLNDSP
ncbi:MAG: N-acetylmuramoyl-L-alanine amidase [Acidobacteria bacterium]|nr:N-acetylmuramoyl-L-alanine amidase [Acidobacteriota bacterium]